MAPIPNRRDEDERALAALVASNAQRQERIGRLDDKAGLLLVGVSVLATFAGALLHSIHGASAVGLFISLALLLLATNDALNALAPRGAGAWATWRDAARVLLRAAARTVKVAFVGGSHPRPGRFNGFDPSDGADRSVEEIMTWARQTHAELARQAAEELQALAGIFNHKYNPITRATRFTQLSLGVIGLDVVLTALLG